MRKPLRIFVGYDTREPIAYHVFSHSLIRRASRPVEIIPLVQSQLREIGLYSRPVDARAATEFSLTRFLVPYLCNYRGYAMFADCDMLALTDVAQVFDFVEDAVETHPVWVCKHDYVPKSEIKMDGQVQSTYPRKNWSSMMLFDCARCDRVTPHKVNTMEPSYLHRMGWAGSNQFVPDSEIGSLPLEWNWLVGEYASNEQAKILHYTLGGPWFKETQNCDHADLWLAEKASLLGS